jgi:ABC-2 type transport system ATP-binding protein
MKCRVGYVSGGVDFYPRKKLRTITQVTRQFYPDWDQRTYEDCLQRFSLVEEKTPGELSQGMKVKYALTLALSHGAELLILDEPTSGLDPVSRGELLEIFLALQDRGTTILFSTHITSDLQRCAQDLLYLRQGRLVAQEPLEDFVARYRQVRLPFPPEDTVQRGKLLGLCREKDGVSALVERANWGDFPQAKEVDLEQVMLHLEREAET